METTCRLSCWARLLEDKVRVAIWMQRKPAAVAGARTTGENRRDGRVGQIDAVDLNIIEISRVVPVAGEPDLKPLHILIILALQRLLPAPWDTVKIRELRCSCEAQCCRIIFEAHPPNGGNPCTAGYLNPLQKKVRRAWKSGILATGSALDQNVRCVSWALQVGDKQKSGQA
jgi:hypothetical protein